MYPLTPKENAQVNLLASGAIMVEAIQAADILRDRGISVTIWSVTSYNELARQGIRAEREQTLTIGESSIRPYVEEILESEDGVFVAVSDYQRALPLSIARWLPGEYSVLGTDGFGLSESRDSLRNYFEVSKDWIVFTALSTLARANRGLVDDAITYADENELDRDRLAPF